MASVAGAKTVMKALWGDLSNTTKASWNTMFGSNANNRKALVVSMAKYAGVGALGGSVANSVRERQLTLGSLGRGAFIGAMGGASFRFAGGRQAFGSAYKGLKKAYHEYGLLGMGGMPIAQGDPRFIGPTQQMRPEFIGPTRMPRQGDIDFVGPINRQIKTVRRKK